MQLLKTLITPEALEKIASRSNFRYGKRLAADAQITVTKSNVFNVHAELQYGQSRAYQVDLMSTTKGFRWKCSCTAKKDYFCEHCVAVGLHASAPQE